MSKQATTACISLVKDIISHSFIFQLDFLKLVGIDHAVTMHPSKISRKGQLRQILSISLELQLLKTDLHPPPPKKKKKNLVLRQTEVRCLAWNSCSECAYIDNNWYNIVQICN